MNVKKVSLIILVSLCLFVGQIYGEYLKIQETDSKITVENDFYSFSIDIKQGGKVIDFFDKTGKQFIVDPDIGSFQSKVWNISEGKNHFESKPFDVSVMRKKGSAVISLSAQGSSGLLNFLKISRIYTVYANNPRIDVRYVYTNLESSMSTLEFAPWFHNTFGIAGGKNIYYVPLESGIQNTQATECEAWYSPIARGWFGVISPDHVGVVCVMEPQHIESFYSWFRDTTVPTMEWRFEPIKIDAGKSFETSASVILLHGLKSINGASQNYVGEIVTASDNFKTPEKISGKVRFIPFTAEAVSCKVQYGKPGSSNRKTVAVEKYFGLAIDKIQEFEFKLSPEQSGTWVIEVLFFDAKNREAGRLEKKLTFGDADALFKLKPLFKLKQKVDNLPDLTRYSNEVVTPHVKWAKPYVKGKTRVLALCNYVNQRELAELSQRFDCEIITTLIDPGPAPQWQSGTYYGKLTHEDLKANIHKILAKSYDVILLAGLKWDYFDKYAQSLIISKVKSGVGLVYIDPVFGQRDPFFITDKLQVKRGGAWEAVASSSIISPVPLKAMPLNGYRSGQLKNATILAKSGNDPLVFTGGYGKGRIIYLVYVSSESGITPLIETAPESSCTWNFWEYYYSLAARSILWACDKLDNDYISQISVKEVQPCTLKVEAILPKSASASNLIAEVCIRDKYYKTIASGQFTCKDESGKLAAIFAKSTLPAGMILVDIILRDAVGNVVDWGGYAFENTRETQLSEVKLGSSQVELGDDIVVEYAVPQNGDDSHVSIAIVDSSGRCIDRFGGKAKSREKIKFKTDAKYRTRYCNVNITLLQNCKVIDRDWKTILIINPFDAEKWDDFEATIWITPGSSNGLRDYLFPYYVARLKDLGVSTVISNNRHTDILSAYYGLNPTFLCGIGIGRQQVPDEYIKTGNKLFLVSKPCLSESTYKRNLLEKCRQFAASVKTYSPRYIWLGDELSLTSYDGKPIDFCFSPTCRKAFRKWLKKRYSRLDALNAQWGTEFKDWDNVIGMTREEVWKRHGGNFSPWADHLEYMDNLFAETLHDVTRSFHSQATKTLVFISGTQIARAYGGMNWFSLMQVLDGLLSYTHGDTGEFHRSFNSNSKLCPWHLGYGSGTNNDTNYKIWTDLFNGFAGVSAFHLPSVVNPDLTFYEGAANQFRAVRKIRSGIGKHRLANLVAKSEIAVHYSQASIRASFILKKQEAFEDNRNTCLKILENLGYQYDFISSEQISGSILETAKYKVLILPDSTAVSSAEIIAMQKFVENGGSVLALGDIATMDGHCKTLYAGQLDNLFGITRKNGAAEFQSEQKIRGNEKFDGVTIKRIVQNIRSKGGSVIFQGKDSVPLLVIHKYGKGNAIFLNGIVGEYESMMSSSEIKPNREIAYRQLALMEFMLAKSSKAPDIAISVIDESGQKILGTRAFAFRDSKQQNYVALSYLKVIKPIQAKLVLPKEKHIFDIIGNRYLGFTKNLNLKISSERPLFLACLNENPDREILVSVPNQIQRGKWYDVDIEFNNGLNYDTVLSLEFIGPDGILGNRYAQSIVVKKSKVSYKFFVAYNSASGKWKLRLKDVVTGRNVEKEFNITPAANNEIFE